jgi:hypothetical protein
MTRSERPWFLEAIFGSIQSRTFIDQQQPLSFSWRNPLPPLSQTLVIQLDTYAGVKRDARPTDSVLVDAALPSAIEQTVAFVRRNTPQPLKVEGLRRTSTEAFPQEALREAIVNAVAHRDYEEAGAKITVEVFPDRVVFSSPGLPPGNQRIEQIAEGQGRSRARNPLIVQGLTWLEFMDERGSGIRRMREGMERHGLELPRFALAGDEFIVTLPAPQESAEELASPLVPDALNPLSTFKSLTEQQSAVLTRVLESGHVQTAWCVQNLGVSRDTAWRLLNDLLEQGLLMTTGTGRGTRYVSGNQLTDQAHQAQGGRKDVKSGAKTRSRAQTGRNQTNSLLRSGVNGLQVERSDEHSHLSTTKANETAFAGGEEEAAKPIRNKGPRIGRNDPCPCGSGKKYKKCCGA